MMQLRDATENDLSLILEFIRDLAEYEKLAHEVVATEEQLKKTLFCENPKAFCTIAEFDGEAAGFAFYFYNVSTFLGTHGIYLEDLFVKPQYRGKKIGHGLLQFLAKKAIQEQCSRVDWMVLDWNKPAIDFYNSIGAKPLNDWTIYRLTGDALEQFGGSQ